MKRYDGILFDLDGTLLPMDMDEFTNGYFQLLAEEIEPYGYPKEKMLAAMWKGIFAMVKNDGSRSNADAFWNAFSADFGEKAYEDIPKFDAFYTKNFHKAKAFTAPVPQAVEAVALARQKADKVILATNPMFPMAAIHSRLSWTGLTSEQFDLITDYENFNYCKPNPAYFTEIIQKMGLDPKNCLMIGNNAEEDAKAALAVGMSAFLVTDCLIAKGELPNCPKGSMTDLLEFLKNA